MADLSRVVAVIPVRSLSGAKSRLGEPLDPEEREALVLAFLRRAIAAACDAPSIAAAVVVSTDPEVLAVAVAAGATPLLQHGDGLNEGLREARAALADRASAMLVLPADLPRLTAAELERLVAQARAADEAPAEARAEAAAGADRGARAFPPEPPVVGLVPDRHGLGTNALLLAPPDAIDVSFGEDSRAAHAAAARLAGARYVELEGPLSLDVDTAEDLLLADLAGLDHEAGR